MRRPARFGEIRYFALVRSLQRTSSRMMTKAQILSLVGWAIALGALSGCTSVAPYERGILAHPSMSPEEMATGFDEHVRAVSEGATGGFGGGGGGCGCN